MSVTWSAVTAMKPDKAVLVRATGLLLGHAMGVTVPVQVEASIEPCWVRFGGAASAELQLWAPGTFEAADRWLIAASPGRREPLDYLLAMTLALTAAELYDGLLDLDNAPYLSDKQARPALDVLLDARHLTPEQLLAAFPAAKPLGEG